jgi:hypothetical protein
MADLRFEEMPMEFARIANALDPDKVQELLDNTEGPLMLQFVADRFDAQSGPTGAWSSDLVETGEFRDSFEITSGEQIVGVGPEGDRNITIAEEQEIKGNVVTGWDEDSLNAVEGRLVEFLDNAFGG